MGIQNLDTTIDDKATAYNACLEIFLTGKWRNTGQIKEHTIPDSNLPGEAVKKQAKKSKETFNIEQVYECFNVSRKDYNDFIKLYEKDIFPRIQKKYLSQLISALEDMIDENFRKKNASKKNKTLKIHEMDRFKITLIEFLPGLENKPTASCLVFSNRAIIFYDPTMDSRTIRISIAHELGHLLSFLGIIPGDKTENYANLFAFIAIINEENNFYVTKNFTNFYSNEMEIINDIKAISSNMM
jgi:hypothetical protein